MKKKYTQGPIDFCIDGELEQWRVETLFTKEPETIAWIEREAGRGKVFWDIGANIGIYSLYAASRSAEMHVYAFEPVLNNFTALAKNIAANPGFAVSPFCMALGNKNALASLYIKDARIANSGAQLNAPCDEYGNSFEAVHKEEVACFTGDFLCEALSFPLPDFIKIDVDGIELQILHGVQSLLEYNATLQSLLIEFNNKEEERLGATYLAKFGFVPDDDINLRAEHSRHRRAEKSGVANNVVFSRLNL